MARPAKVYRGSRRRFERIRTSGNWSLGLWIVILSVLAVLFGLVPLMLTASKAVR
jgi:hypothetical protein